jgi:hypothetical protein
MDEREAAKLLFILKAKSEELYRHFVAMLTSILKHL